VLIASTDKVAGSQIRSATYGTAGYRFDPYRLHFFISLFREERMVVCARKIRSTR